MDTSTIFLCLLTFAVFCLSLLLFQKNRTLSATETKLESVKDLLTTSECKRRWAQEENERWHKTNATMNGRALAAEAQAHAAMLDGGFEELEQLRKSVKNLCRERDSMEQTRDDAVTHAKEMKALATLAAVTVGRPNVSSELISAIGLTLSGGMQMNEFKNVADIERNKALTDGNGVRQIPSYSP